MAKQIVPNEAINLLSQAAHKIKSMREENERMRIRLNMFDDCMALLTARIERHGQGMEPAIEFEIEKYIKNNLDVE